MENIKENFKKNIETCRICQKPTIGVKHLVHCPRFSTPICMSHCYGECKYREEDHCLYYKKVKNE